MFCPRHGEVEHVSTNNDSAHGAAIHFLSCGCYGTAEQLRDENYPGGPVVAPDTRVADLEARVADLEAAAAEHAATIEGKDAAIAALKDTLSAAPEEPPSPAAPEAEPEAGADAVTPAEEAPAAPPEVPTAKGAA